MAVLVEGVTVLVTNAALQHRFPGGPAAYEQQCPNATYRSDGRLSAVSFMVVDDAKRYTATLAGYGLADPWANASNEIAVVDEGEGFLTRCDSVTLDLRTFPDDRGGTFGAILAWLPGEELETFVAPAGWRPHRLEQVSGEELERSYEVLRIDRTPDGLGAVVVYRHRETGRMLCVGRPVLPDVDEAATRYVALRDELRRVQALPVSRTRDEALASLSDRITDLAKSTDYREPGPLLLQGIAARLSGRWNAAEQAFRKVTELRPELLDGWLELTWALAKQDRLKQAEASARRAIDVDANSAAAYGNLAGVLLQNGQAAAALPAITRAVELDPADALNQTILQQVRDALRQGSIGEADADVPWYKRLFK